MPTSIEIQELQLALAEAAWDDITDPDRLAAVALDAILPALRSQAFTPSPIGAVVREVPNEVLLNEIRACRREVREFAELFGHLVRLRASPEAFGSTPAGGNPPEGVLNL